MVEPTTQPTNPSGGEPSVGKLPGVPRRLASAIFGHKVAAVAVATFLAIAMIGVALWTTGFLGGGQQQAAIITPNETPPPETRRRATSSAGPVDLVTAVPSDPACNRATSASPSTDQFAKFEIENATLTGVVQILTDVSTGSGIVADPAGLIVTDSQVVEGSWLIKVRLVSGETVRGELLGISEGRGVAYIRVATDATLTSMPLGNSDEVCVGDRAFGVSYGQSSASSTIVPTVTEGRVASIRENHLWTDHSIDRGGAGGPLIDSLGKVIGVISSGLVVRDGGGVAAANFAIPINGVKQEINEGVNQSKLTTPSRSAAEPTAPP